MRACQASRWMEALDPGRERRGRIQGCGRDGPAAHIGDVGLHGDNVVAHVVDNPEPPMGLRAQHGCNQVSAPQWISGRAARHEPWRPLPDECASHGAPVMPIIQSAPPGSFPHMGQPPDLDFLTPRRKCNAHPQVAAAGTQPGDIRRAQSHHPSRGRCAPPSLA